MSIYPEFPGLVVEKLPSGAVRYRVRMEGDTKKRVTISVGPGHYDFLRQYHDARAGVASRNQALERLRQTGSVDRQVTKMASGAASRARSRGQVCEITKEDILGLLLDQECKCAVSGVEFDLRDDSERRRRAWAPSLDRIDNSKGYTISNVRLTVAIVNTALSNWSFDDFLEMCRRVAAARS